MIRFIANLFIIALLSPSIAATTSTVTTTNATLSAASLRARIQSRRLDNHHQHHRKMLSVGDPTTILHGQYIVLFDPDTVTNVTSKAKELFTSQQVVYEYDNIAIKGVSIRNVTTLLLSQLENNSEILFIAPEVAMSYATNTILYNATHNLDRLDDKFQPLDGKYKRKSDGGKGVTVFVLDSGIRASHVEFEGRASCGYDVVLGNESNIPCEDIAGHGTHVAGLIGGKTVGVAKQVTIVAVKVSTKNFTLASGGVIKGIEYVLRQKQRNPSKAMIANLSFGTQRYDIFDIMIEALLRVGVTVVTSAGNQGNDSCLFSPSGINGVITVGASDEWDEVPWWSNFGTCVDIYAPGTNVISAGKRDDTRYVLSGGTSQSAPLVAGVAALYLQIQPTLTPAQVSHLLYLDSLKNVLIPGLHEIYNTTVPITTGKNRLLHTRIFTDANPWRQNPTCPYTGRKLHLCYKEGWWKK